ncbi:HNH endonuclease [Virgibacillus siamensis]|uniref:HNH endonuclease n=1 Tax=Virgibacillus siamensis TaxID=480071 RepID=UPI000986D27A|nr:HNH endonuclease [Virgibacillus siamensis]
MKGEVYRSGESIYINKPKANKLAYTEYNEELFNILKSYTWTVKGEYLYSNKLKKYLHRYVMEFYYGKEAIDEANKKNFVVDHIDNNGFNCRVSNLCFIPNNLNKAKGLTFDKRRIEMKEDMTLTFYKDFSTGQF